LTKLRSEVNDLKLLHGEEVRALSTRVDAMGGKEFTAISRHSGEEDRVKGLLDHIDDLCQNIDAVDEAITNMRSSTEYEKRIQELESRVEEIYGMHKRHSR
jgi:DNA repair ATPase RecN